MLGGMLALLAAASFAFSNVCARRGVITGSVFQALVVTVPIGIPIFVAAALAAGSLGALTQFSSPAAIYLSTAGILHFVFGRYCNFRAISAMGVNLASPVQQSSLLFSLGLAVWLLGEVLTPLRMLGIVLILAGPAIMLRSRRTAGRPSRSETQAAPDPAGAVKTGFTPRYAEGYAFAILSAVCYGVSPILIRAALRDTDPGTGIAGGLISYASATAVLAFVLAYPAARRHVVSVRGQPAKWFVAAGIFVCISQMIRYMALSLAPVTVVAPILLASGIFRVVFGWMVNRDHEDFGVWVIAGILVALVGALTVTLGTEFLLSLVSLPDFVREAARWQWPGR